MDRQDLAAYYGFGSFPDELHSDIYSLKSDSVDSGELLRHVCERLGDKNFYLFATCDVTEFEDRQLPYTEFVEKKYGIKGELLYAPILGVAHYMSRRGLFLISEENLSAALKAMLDFPYHFYAVISDIEPSHEGIEALIAETRGMALLPHIARKCLDYITGTGAGFLHAVKRGDDISLNLFYRD